jgi:glycosyltransferase involved in cell wall biosynthesis
VVAAFGRYDVVHFHAEGPCAMLWLPKLFGKRCVATIHGLDHQRAKWGRFARAYIMLGEKCAAKFADEIIVLSKGVQQYFRDTYGRETVFIPNGVSKPEIREAKEITDCFGLEKDSYILFLGRLVPEKGIHYLIEAYRNTKTDKKLVIAGGVSDSGEYGEELKKLANNHSDIVFTCFVQGRLLEELYSNAYLYVLPSDLEGMPLSLLEAMSYGNCCVTSDIEECAPVITDHGVTFPKGNVASLTETLQNLCNDTETVIQHKDKAANYITAKYSWDDVTERTLELYQ